MQWGIPALMEEVLKVGQLITEGPEANTSSQPPALTTILRLSMALVEKESLQCGCLSINS